MLPVVDLNDLVHPIGHVVKRLFHRNVVDQQDALAPTKVRGGNGTKAFLAGRVPDQ